MKKKLFTLLMAATIITSTVIYPVDVKAEEVESTEYTEVAEPETEEIVEEETENMECVSETPEEVPTESETEIIEDDKKGTVYYPYNEDINSFILDYKEGEIPKYAAMSGMMAYNVAKQQGKGDSQAFLWGSDIEIEMENTSYQQVKDKYNLSFLDDVQWISGYESYFDEAPGTTPGMVVNSESDTTQTCKINGLCWVYQTDHVDVGVNYTANKGAEFRWMKYNLDTSEWSTISDWSNSNWSSWYGEYGNYLLQCDIRTPDGTCTDKTAMCFAYTAGNTQISGTYAGYRNSNEILLGCSSYTGTSGETYSFKIYNIDTGEWIYITDKKAAQWVTWKPKKGNYWTHFELYTADGRLADSKTYCFAVK